LSVFGLKLCGALGQLTYGPVERTRDAIGCIPCGVGGSSFDAFEGPLSQSCSVSNLLGLELELEPS